MNRNKLRHKLILVFTVAGILVAVLAAVSVYSVIGVAKKYEEVVGVRCGAMIMADEMKRNAEAAEKYILSAIACADTDLADGYLAKADAELEAMKYGYNYLKENGGVDEELLERIGSFIFTPSQVKETMFSSIRGGSFNIGRNMFYSEYSASLQEVNGYLDALRVTARSSLEVGKKQAEIGYFGGKRLCVIVCMMCISVIAFFGLYLDRMVRRVGQLSERLSRATRRITEQQTAPEENAQSAYIPPSAAEIDNGYADIAGIYAPEPQNETVNIADIIINDAARCMNEIADGNDPTPEADYSDGYGFVLSAVRKVKAYLKGIMMQIGRAAEYVAAEAERVAGISGELSESAREQTECLGSLSAAAEDISDMLRRCEFIEKNLGKVCDSADKQLDDSLRILGEAGVAAAEACAVTSELEIIVKATEDIASRANIFAVHAAMAAAGAGAAGRGFAAAADEARVLAMKSAEISAAAKGVIGRFSEATIKSGQASAGAIAAVSDVRGFAMDISSSLSATEELYGKMLSAVDEIKSDSDRISGLIRTGAAASEKCAASERTLSEQTDILRRVADSRPV